jgi:hypothetical protein
MTTYRIKNLQGESEVVEADRFDVLDAGQDHFLQFWGLGTDGMPEGGVSGLVEMSSDAGSSWDGSSGV